MPVLDWKCALHLKPVGPAQSDCGTYDGYISELDFGRADAAMAFSSIRSFSDSGSISSDAVKSFEYQEGSFQESGACQ
jgi:hypothetical protein